MPSEFERCRPKCTRAVINAIQLILIYDYAHLRAGHYPTSFPSRFRFPGYPGHVGMMEQGLGKGKQSNRLIPDVCVCVCVEFSVSFSVSS